ncbi:MAG: hypothetical protein Q8L48_02240 [Archangium sp.]|nr:hypothetical protein [Archangium sp.]
MRWLALIAVLSLPVLADVAPPPPAEPTVAPVVAPLPAPVAPEHPGGNANAPAAPMGVIEGGWAYVYAAWGAGIFGLIAYAASLFLRRSDAPPPGAS